MFPVPGEPALLQGLGSNRGGMVHLGHDHEEEQGQEHADHDDRAGDEVDQQSEMKGGVLGSCDYPLDGSEWRVLRRAQEKRREKDDGCG